LKITALVVLAMAALMANPAAAQQPHHDMANMMQPPAAAFVATAPDLDRSGWTATASSVEGARAAQLVLDGSAATLWQSRVAQPIYPAWLVIDTKNANSISGLRYKPRQDASPNGVIGRYSIEVSIDGYVWSPSVTTGTWADDRSDKTASFAAVTARFVRLTALSEAGNRGRFAAAAEINLIGEQLGRRLDRTAWTVVADSQQAIKGNLSALAVMDGNAATFWQSKTTPTVAPLPHTLTFDMKDLQTVSGLWYVPRRDGQETGRIGQYAISTSAYGDTFTDVATGTWSDTTQDRLVQFAPVVARYVRLTARSEAGNRGQFTTVGEVDVMGLPLPDTYDPAGFTAVADSYESISLHPGLAIDGKIATMWRTPVKGKFPHFITIDMHAVLPVAGLVYRPRIDNNKNGNIGDWRIAISGDGVTFIDVAGGTWADDANMKIAPFRTLLARYVRLTAATEAGKRGLSTNAAEIGLVPGVIEPLPRGSWTATADSVEPGYPATNVLDGNVNTIWLTATTGTPVPSLPHQITIDTRQLYKISGLTYLPRRGGGNGTIGGYEIATSSDGVLFTTVATGNWPDGDARRTVTFASVLARYVRLKATSEAGGRGPWSSAAEIQLLGDPPAPSVGGAWSAPIGFPIVPVSAAALPNNKVLAFSAYSAYAFGGGTITATQTALLDLETNVVSQRTVAETGHEMFCTGLATLADGRIVINGGLGPSNTTIYDPTANTFVRGPQMSIARGYETTLSLSDGRAFTIGGAWSGVAGVARNAEVMAPNGGWSRLAGIPVNAIVAGGVPGSGGENYAYLFATSDGGIFHAGPSKQMNWFSTLGQGSVTPAGNRGADAMDAMNGNAVMYDIGKILTIGGRLGIPATSRADVIDISRGPTLPVTVKGTPGLTWPRVHQNSVVLPDGKVMVIGGQQTNAPFTDNAAVFHPEFFDPATGKFAVMNPMAIPRNYHSVALLLSDARVFAGGGGLCGTCATNHPDAEIFSPPYLFNTDGTLRTRPVINTAPRTAVPGTLVAVETNGAVTQWVLVRNSTVTHSINSDQRRVPLTFTTQGATRYTLNIPADRGIVVPGEYMLFAMNAAGTPSVAKFIRIN
jgi:galactose oxidase